MDMELDLYQVLVYRRQGGILPCIEIAATHGEVSKPFLSLAYAAFGEMSKAENILDSLDKGEETLFELEAKMLLAISRHKRPEAITLAYKILDKYPNAAFARYFLASNAIREKRPQETLDHCQIFLQHYPGHDNVTLQMSETLAYLKKYQQSMQYAKQCKPGLKQKLYVLLIPSVFPRYRLVLLFLGILAAAVELHVLVLIIILLTLVAGIAISLLKDNGTLIPARLLYLGMMVTISWWFGHWVWSLMQGK